MVLADRETDQKLLTSTALQRQPPAQGKGERLEGCVPAALSPCTLSPSPPSLHTSPGGVEHPLTTRTQLQSREKKVETLSTIAAAEQGLAHRRLESVW